MNDFFRSDDEFFQAAEEVRERLLYIARVKLYDIYEAEDAVAEALLKANKKRHQLRDREKLHNWLMTIVVNHCNDILREKLPAIYSDRDLDTVVMEDSRELPPHDRIELTLDIERILDIMLSLEPEEHSEVVILYYYRKFPYEKIAEILEVPVGTVKSRMNRARKRLREALERAGVSREEIEAIQDISRWPEIRLIR